MIIRFIGTNVQTTNELKASYDNMRLKLKVNEVLSAELSLLKSFGSHTDLLLKNPV